MPTPESRQSIRTRCETFLGSGADREILVAALRLARRTPADGERFHPDRANVATVRGEGQDIADPDRRGGAIDSAPVDAQMSLRRHPLREAARLDDPREPQELVEAHAIHRAFRRAPRRHYPWAARSAWRWASGPATSIAGTLRHRGGPCGSRAVPSIARACRAVVRSRSRAPDRARTARGLCVHRAPRARCVRPDRRAPPAALAGGNRAPDPRRTHRAATP